MEEVLELRKENKELYKRLAKADSEILKANSEMRKLIGLVEELSDSRAEALGLDKNIERRKIKDRISNTQKNGKTPILQTDLSSRTAFKLYRSGFYYIEDLNRTSKKKLKSINGIGESTINELVNIGKEYNVHINDE